MVTPSVKSPLDATTPATAEPQVASTSTLPPTPQAIVQLADVVVRLGQQLVLDRVSLTVSDRDYIAIIGPNGGGKTTLLRTILGLVALASGSVEVFGTPAAKLTHEQRAALGYVPQQSLFDRALPLRVRDIVEMGRLGRAGALGPRYSREDRAIAARALEQVGIASLAKQRVGTLSGGELQRTLIARALASQPRLLLMDEPLASIDVAAASQVAALLVELHREIPIIVVTHDISAIAGAVTRIACLNRRLHTHHERLFTAEMLEAAYGCPIDLLGHLAPHVHAHPPGSGAPACDHDHP